MKLGEVGDSRLVRVTYICSVLFTIKCLVLHLNSCIGMFISPTHPLRKIRVTQNMTLSTQSDVLYMSAGMEVNIDESMIKHDG